MTTRESTKKWLGKEWVLRIYAGDARTLNRVSWHVSRKAAFAALARHEAKWGRKCNAIDHEPRSKVTP